VVFTNDCIRFPVANTLTVIRLFRALIYVNSVGNNRPKKCLNYKTPYEAFEELTGVDIKNLLGYALMT
jgi:IS30 family transposase